MPLYEYYCEKCDSKFELLRPMSKMDDAASCPKCATASKRMLSRFSAFSKGMGGLSKSLVSDSCSSCSSTSCDSCH